MDMADMATRQFPYLAPLHSSAAAQIGMGAPWLARLRLTWLGVRQAEPTRVRIRLQTYRDQVVNLGLDTKHVPCKFFRQGTCQAGNACPFSHSMDPMTQQAPCKYFMKVKLPTLDPEPESDKQRATASSAPSVFWHITCQMGGA